MPLALSICVMFILLKQSVNGAQFLNTTSFMLLLEFAAGDGIGKTAIVSLIT